MKLPRIYKESKTGAIVICDISTEGDTITVTTGQLDGKMQDHLTVCKAMNVGRSNETTPHEQAILEAKAKHTKKIKAGYVLDPSGVQTVQLPMKVKKYQDQKNNVQFPCWISPKLDGLNGEFRTPDDKTFELFSRGGDNYPMLDHVLDEIDTLMVALDTKRLNGEIYKHGMHLQDITSAVKKHNKNTPSLEFHVFDIPNSSKTYDEKLEEFNAIDNSKFDHVKVIRAHEANSHEEIEEYMEKFLGLGYEGIIIRNKHLVYEYNVRSCDVFKYKIPLDREYKITGWRADKKGHPVFECITPINEGAYTFNVKPKGNHERRLAIAQEADTWIGKWLKIEFENYSKILKPLKPVGIGLRECDAEGNPLE